MKNDKKLIEKIYYEHFLPKDSDKEALRVLGDAYMEECEKDIPNLSDIRYAQGELYFHYKDFESAIFKWSNIQNELEPWAKKNTADAYFELGEFSTSEETYHSIITDDLTLQTEISLQLFSLYIEQQKTEYASQKIKETVELNPDYENVTMLACAFFEKHEDWASAVDLALNEAIRLESPYWYDVLIGYVEKGLTREMEPAYFAEGLAVLAYVDSIRFESLVSALWKSYRQGPLNIAWTMIINDIVKKLGQEQIGSWSELSKLHRESYLHFISGDYLLKDINKVIPQLLTNWLRIQDDEHILQASAAVLSWNEFFPHSLEAATVYEAENFILDLDAYGNDLDTVINLAADVLHWATKQDWHLSKPLEWITKSLMNKEKYQLLVVGSYESGKSDFINTIMNQVILPDDGSVLTKLDYGEELEIKEISETDVVKVDRIEEQPSFRYQCSYQVNLDHEFLKRNQISIIDTPNIQNSEIEGISSHLQMADGILFVLNAHSGLTEAEKDIFWKIREKMPYTPIHFLLNKMDSIYDEHEAVKLINQMISQIGQQRQEIKVFAYSSHYDYLSQLRDFNRFIQEHYKNYENDLERTTNLLYYVRSVISDLLTKRIDKENALVDSIKWNEGMLAKVSGAVHQIEDVEAEKIRVMSESYEVMKEELEQELWDRIPELLRGCSDFIKEDSDFGHVHIELNEEMNKQVIHYLEGTALPGYYDSIGNWIEDCHQVFNEVQYTLDEMCDSFNELYGEEKLRLECDFQVLDDWKRDANRMTSGIYWEDVNILLRFTPSQFLLKSAGKLFSGFTQNKSMIYNKYKNFIETEDYQEITELIIKRFFQQFELFEKSMERDIALFFREPLNILKRTVEETDQEIQVKKEELQQMSQNPELYRDPLTFFELKLRQNEWLNQKENKMFV